MRRLSLVVLAHALALPSVRIPRSCLGPTLGGTAVGAVMGRTVGATDAYRRGGR